MTRIHKRLYSDPWTTLVFFIKTFFPKSLRNQSSSYINSSQASFNPYQLRFIHDAPLGATINKPVPVATTLSAYVVLASDRRNYCSLIPVLTLSSSCFDCPECKPWTDDISSIIHVKKLESLLILLVPVEQCKVIKCGVRKNSDCLVSFSIVSRRRKKKEEGGQKVSGRMRNSTTGNRGQTSFHRSNCLIYWIV